MSVEWDSGKYIKFFVAGCATALCIFVLTTRHLITVYLYLLSIGVIFVSYWSNVSTVKAITAYLETEGNSASILDDILSLNFNVLMNHGPGYLIVQNYMLQYLLGFVFCYVHFAPRYGFVQKALLLSFWWPSILGISPISVRFFFSWEWKNFWLGKWRLVWFLFRSRIIIVWSWNGNRLFLCQSIFISAISSFIKEKKRKVSSYFNPPKKKLEK